MEKDILKKTSSNGTFRFGKAIQMVANQFRRLGDENLSKHSINVSQLRILGYLRAHEKEGKVFQKDLEEAFGVRRSSVTSILQNMEKSGYLIREGTPEDARVKAVRLTEKGEELDASLIRYIHSLEEEMLQGITPEEKELLAGALMKMLENLEQCERKKV